MEAKVKEKRKFAFEGFHDALDVLWGLIRENKFNVYDIPMAEITEQFQDYLDYAVELDLQDLSDFYLWAAKLANIKTRMMLPVEVRLDVSGEVEDPREELVQQLIEYQRFKKLSILMEAQEEQSEWSFERKKIERFLPFDDEEDMWQKVDSWTLLQDMQKYYKSFTTLDETQTIVGSEEITSQEKIALMEELLDRHGQCMFTDLITRRGNPLDALCAFIAILEAVKMKIADIYQNKMFGDIKICRKKMAA